MKPKLNPGIYIIRNTVNSKVYVGSTSNLRNRERQHRYELGRGNHSNPHLQNFCNKYGVDVLIFEILEITSVDALINREQFYIDLHESCDRQFGFNSSPSAGSCLGFQPTEETKMKLRKAGTGRRHSEETKQKIGKANRGSKRSEDARRKMSEAAKGRSVSLETRRKQSEHRKGKPKSESFKAALAQRNRDRVVSDQTKQKISLALKGKQTCLGRVMSPETRKKISDSRKNHFAKKNTAADSPLRS